MKTTTAWWVAAAAVMAWASQASAVKYMAIGEAVKKFIPADAKILKVTKTPSADERKRLLDDYGWEASEPEYVTYVGKDKADDAKTLGYVFIIPEIFNTCFHKYAIGVAPDGKILESVIIELTCPRSFPINKKAFLGQFKDKTHNDPLTTKVDIDGITGATLSSEAASTAARKAVSLHNIFFGGNQKVVVDEKVKAGRAAAAARIKKAIANGETLKKQGKDGAAQLPPEDPAAGTTPPPPPPPTPTPAPK
jgi:hypothetical protein